MADSASESDSSSIDGGPIMMPPSPVTREQLSKRIESLQQQNRVLRIEMDTYKLRVKALQEENKALRQASVNIQAKAEQEEEFISNTLMKQIQTLKKEKEALAHTFEQEEECLTNDLSRKLNKLKAEKCKLEQSLEQEQECLVNKLMRKIEKLEAETSTKQNNLEQLRREKVELENTLEQEQEALVNRLWKRMDKLEAEKRNLQNKVVAATGNPIPSPGSGGGGSSSIFSTFGDSISHSRDHRQRRTSSGSTGGGMQSQSISSPSNAGGDQELPMALADRSIHLSDNDIITMTGNVQHLRSEVERLKAQLAIAQQHHTEKMSHFALEEKQIREENLRLQRRLQLEMERREALCRHLSESESSLEMEDERHFHEFHGSGNHGQQQTPHSSSAASISGPVPVMRPRPGSSPGPSFVPSPGTAGAGRPLSPGLHLSCSGSGRSGGGLGDIMSPPSPVSRCNLCNGQGWVQPSIGGQLLVTTSSANNSPSSCFAHSSSPPIRHSNQSRGERFARPAPPSSDRAQEPRTPGDSTMSSPSPSPAPLDTAVLSPLSAPSPTTPSPMDITKN